MRVVRRSLKIPNHLSRVGVERDDGFGIQIRACPVLVRNHGLWIARRDVNQVQFRIIRDRLPRHASAVFHRVLVRPRFRTGVAHLLRHDVPAPLHFARDRIVRLDVSGSVQIVAADACNHMIFDDHRRGGPELIQIANRFAPAFLAVFQIQRNQIAIRRFDIKRIAQNAYAAIADVDAACDFQT